MEFSNKTNEPLQTKLEEKCEELSQQFKNVQTILDHIGAYVFTKDLEGRYTYVNELVRELFDFPLDEIIGFDDSKFFELDLSNDIKVNDNRVMSNGETIDEEEKTIIVKTGEVKYYQTVKKPLYDDEKNIIGMFGVSTDITKRKLMEFELKRKQELLDTVLNNVDAYIYMKDIDYKYLYLNPKTASLFGKSVDEVLGKKEEEFISKEKAEHFRRMDAKVFESGSIQSGQEDYITSDGILHNYWSTKVPIKDSDGEIRSYIGISTDITQLSTTDALTGIANRRTLDIEINKIDSLFKRYKLPHCVIMADIDLFKNINDTFGHFEGDKVLQLISKTIQNMIRSTDTFGRWGGEEFLILCPNIKLQDAVEIAEKLRAKIEGLSLEVDCQLTMSFGVAQSNQDDTDPYAIVKRADKKLYKAKELGRNQVAY